MYFQKLFAEHVKIQTLHIFFQVQQADGRWVLIGLVSAGFSCGKPGQPGIYHRISATSDWITKQAYNHLFF